MRAAVDQSGRLRDRLREETEATILSAAERVIAEEGLHAARVERIAAHAGVSVGTIYNHFKDRTALVQALFDDRGDGLSEMFAEALASSEGRPLAVQARAVIWAMAEHALAHRRLFAALLQEHHGPARIRPPEVSRAALVHASTVIVERSRRAGELRDDPEGVFPEALTALARQAFAFALEGGETARRVDALASFFVRAVGR